MNAKELIKEVEKEDEMRQGNISLILEGYNDLFSDFDPRPTEQRALSDDFLIEVKRAARDKELGLELRLLMPKIKRNLLEESKIKKRIKTHFNKYYKEKIRDIKRLRIEGGLLCFVGIALSIAATFIYSNTSFLSTLALVILEPAGWFSIWNGLDKLFFEIRGKKPEIDFYKKMANAEVSFISY
jgi:hypothetical protein